MQQVTAMVMSTSDVVEAPQPMHNNASEEDGNGLDMPQQDAPVVPQSESEEASDDEDEAATSEDAEHTVTATDTQWLCHKVETLADFVAACEEVESVAKLVDFNLSETEFAELLEEYAGILRPKTKVLGQKQRQNLQEEYTELRNPAILAELAVNPDRLSSYVHGIEGATTTGATTVGGGAIDQALASLAILSTMLCARCRVADARAVSWAGCSVS
jgi:hypothetical protein